MTKTKQLHILVSNDDGIDAPGIQALTQEMKKLGAVTVVAPDKQRSAVGHAITMNYPLRATKYYQDGEFFGYAVEGTPADCVKLAIRSLLPEKPDLLVSGINHGSNTAINIIYSGTVSAATEGTILGIPSIAFSLTTFGPNPDFLVVANRSGMKRRPGILNDVLGIDCLTRGVLLHHVSAVFIEDFGEAIHLFLVLVRGRDQVHGADIQTVEGFVLSPVGSCWNSGGVKKLIIFN